MGLRVSLTLSLMVSHPEEVVTSLGALFHKMEVIGIQHSGHFLTVSERPLTVHLDVSSVLVTFQKYCNEVRSPRTTLVLLLGSHTLIVCCQPIKEG